MAPAFRALGDPSRRLLLDRLFERDGQTLGELCAHLPAMTRFGVMRHLGVLEEAGLVTTRKEGREKRHFLNPVPIRLVHDRWISKFAEPVVGAMAAIKTHLEAEAMSSPDHVYAVYIKAAPDRVWRAITDGVETEQLLLRHPRELRLVEGRPDRLRVPRRLGRGRRRGPRDRPGPARDDVVPRPMGSRGRGRGPGPDDLGDRADRRRRARSSPSRPPASSPARRWPRSSSGGIVYIVSGLKTFVETGAPMAVPVEAS